MDIISTLNVSAQGIQRNIRRLDTAAEQLANPEDEDAVQPVVDLIVAGHDAQANINAFRTAARMNRALLDILA